MSVLNGVPLTPGTYDLSLSEFGGATLISFTGRSADGQPSGPLPGGSSAHFAGYIDTTVLTEDDSLHIIVPQYGDGSGTQLSIYGNNTELGLFVQNGANGNEGGAGGYISDDLFGWLYEETAGDAGQIETTGLAASLTFSWIVPSSGRAGILLLCKRQ